MAVRWRVGTDHLKTCSIVYYAPDGTRVVERVGVLRPDATSRERDALEGRAALLSATRRSEVASGTWTPPAAKKAAGLTLKEAVARFLREYRSRSGSKRYYAERADVWLDGLPTSKPLRRITAADVERFRDERAAKVSGTTVRKDLIALGTFFRWARSRGLVDANPADRDLVRRPKAEPHRLERLAPDQETALLDACPPWLARIVRWCLYSGMDRSEAIGLVWADVDEAHGRAHCPRAKTGEPRTVRLNGTLREVLAEARKVRTIAGEGRVFLGRTGRPVTVNGANLALKRAYSAAGVPCVAPWKRLRHEYASRLAEQGAGTFELMQLLGHTTPTMAAVYVNLTDEHLQTLVERLDRARGKNRTSGRTSKSPQETAR